MTKVYLAGPMSGIPQFNYPMFMSVADKLRELGMEVRNPAEMDDEKTQALAMASTDGSLGSGTWQGETWGDFLSRDVKIVADDVDGVVLLPNWQTSRGARLEAFVALSVQKPVWLWNEESGHLMSATAQAIASDIMDGTVDQGDVSRYG